MATITLFLSRKRWVSHIAVSLVVEQRKALSNMPLDYNDTTKGLHLTTINRRLMRPLDTKDFKIILGFEDLRLHCAPHSYPFRAGLRNMIEVVPVLYQDLEADIPHNLYGDVILSKEHQDQVNLLRALENRNDPDSNWNDYPFETQEKLKAAERYRLDNPGEEKELYPHIRFLLKQEKLELYPPGKHVHYYKGNDEANGQPDIVGVYENTMIICEVKKGDYDTSPATERHAFSQGLGYGAILSCLNYSALTINGNKYVIVMTAANKFVSTVYVEGRKLKHKISVHQILPRKSDELHELPPRKRRQKTASASVHKQFVITNSEDATKLFSLIENVQRFNL
ncbi:hypothetical protein BC829DRAFT_409345 [Chytridium lagenaria]|nr:hypothetical protein BC829DRAFT_409345 [Chytridium lagenaria]